ncbi:hypothetical protein FOXYSP1_19324 [Fusarium oxysporum f. sp. phaseoli]
MALPHKQAACDNLAALWVGKQFPAKQMQYLEVPLLPGGLGHEPGVGEIK